MKLEDIPDFTENPIFGYNVTLDRSEDGTVYLKYPYKAADGRTFYRRCELTPTENPVGEPETLPYLGGNDTIISATTCTTRPAPAYITPERSTGEPDRRRWR